MERREWQVRGRVQGVGFRWSTRAEARKLGLVGWVRNESDGSVRAAAAGPGDGLDALERWLGEGPAAARVEAVEREPEVEGRMDDPGDLVDFEIRH